MAPSEGKNGTKQKLKSNVVRPWRKLFNLLMLAGVSNIQKTSSRETLNPSNAKATFVQRIRTQIVLKTI